MAAVLSQSAVNEDYDKTSATVHQEGRHADGESVFDDFLFQAVNAAFELDELLGAAKNAHLPQQRDDLCQNRGRSGAAYAHVHSVDENRIEDGVSHHSHDGSIHGQLRMPRRTQDGVESEETVRDDVTQQNNFHVLPGVGECGGAGTEKAQNRVEKDQRHNAEQDTQNQGQGDHVAEDVLCGFVILLSQSYGY